MSGKVFRTTRTGNNLKTLPNKRAGLLPHVYSDLELKLQIHYQEGDFKKFQQLMIDVAWAGLCPTWHRKGKR